MQARHNVNTSTAWFRPRTKELCDGPAAKSQQDLRGIFVQFFEADVSCAAMEKLDETGTLNYSIATSKDIGILQVEKNENNTEHRNAWKFLDLQVICILLTHCFSQKKIGHPTERTKVQPRKVGLTAMIRMGMD